MERHLITHYKQAFLFMTLSCLCLLLTSCGKLSGQIEAVFTRPKVQDFKKSEIIQNGPGIADGQSALTVAISLMNSDGSVVPQFKPTYDIVSGTGVLPAACTTSNNNGISTCLLKATQAGVKKLSVTNIQIPLEADLIFTNPQFKPIFGFVAADKKQSTGTYTLSATIGSQEPGIVKTSGTHKLYGGVQGEGFSR